MLSYIWPVIDDVSFLEGEQSMTNRIFPIPDLHYEMKGQATQA